MQYKRPNPQVFSPLTVTASIYQCAEHYMGPNAASEPETQAISRAVMDRKHQIKGFISVHAYAQLWLTRWAYTNTSIDDHDEQVRNESETSVLWINNRVPVSQKSEGEKQNPLSKHLGKYMYHILYYLNRFCQHPFSLLQISLANKATAAIHDTSGYTYTAGVPYKVLCKCYLTYIK